MELTKELVNYLNNIKINKSIKSNFLLTDLRKVIYADTECYNDYYLSKELDNFFISLINKWSTTNISQDNMFVENNPSVSIICNDNQVYSAIMVFPIYNNDKVEGLAIYFRNLGNYISSSSKAPNTIRKWIMKFLGCDAFPIY